MTQATNELATLQAAEAKLLLQTYARNPQMFVRGHDVYLTDEHGHDYLDLLGGIGVTALGYAHPTVTKTIADQAATLIHTSNIFYHRGTTELALRLTEISGMDRAFLCNSGTEAWEAALKLARAHALLLRSEGKMIGTKILALEHSFHGRSMGSVSTTHKLQYRDPFAPLIPGVEFVAFNDVADLRAKFSADVCAICVEVLQGEGGIHPLSQEFFATARELCDSTGALLIADEIQSGMGRTGRWFAYQQFDIQPDVTTVAKQIANGLPAGALLCTEDAARAMKPGMHGTTFGGGPLACAVACEVIDTIKRDHLLEHVTEVGGYFKAQLQVLANKYAAVADVRGSGLMLGMELHDAELAKTILGEMMERRIILNRTSETVLRFLPPYVLSKENVDTAIAALDELLCAHSPTTEDASSAQTLAGEAVHG